MTTPTEFRRLNFFTGFFTTATDWTEGQQYYLEKLKLHNRGLHTPGVIRGVGQELQVEPVGGDNGLSVRVLPGAAIDSDGNEIYLGSPRTLGVVPGEELPELVYIAIRYAERNTDYVENVESPQYSGHTRVTEIPVVEVTTTQPNNRTSLELARLDLQPGVTSVEAPTDPDNPAGNQIDRRFVTWAGAVATALPALTPDQLETITTIMQDKRQDFAALDRRFPVPSAGDVRAAALTVDLLARVGSLRSEQLSSVLAVLVSVEQDVEQELGTEYPWLTTSNEFQAYQAAVDGLQTALRDGLDTGVLLIRQSQVSEAARQLSEIVIQPPAAAPGPPQNVTVSGEQATVRLDASASQGFGGRTIVRYRWDRTSPGP
jgi:hypothetical protein